MHPLSTERDEVSFLQGLGISDQRVQEVRSELAIKAAAIGLRRILSLLTIVVDAKYAHSSENYRYACQALRKYQIAIAPNNTVGTDDYDALMAECMRAFPVSAEQASRGFRGCMVGTVLFLDGQDDAAHALFKLPAARKILRTKQ